MVLDFQYAPTTTYSLMERFLRLMVVLVLCFLSKPSTSEKVLCRGGEREALLSFKGGIIDDPLKLLSSWTGEECCVWEGIVCHHITGHVLKLHLPDSSMEGDLNNSLLALKHLEHLDLSENYFRGPIPKFIASLTNLRYLNLSNAGFEGPIPHQLGNLSSLYYLDIRSTTSEGSSGWCQDMWVSSSLSMEDLEWISGLTSLKFLDMSGVDLSKASNWLQVLNKLHSLSVLHLSYCDLDSLGSLSHVNFSSLTALDLSCNYNLTSSKFDWLSDMSSLVVLDLSDNKFHGPIPGDLLGNMTSLKFLSLSSNRFTSNIPLSLFHISAIERLDLSSNKLQGKLPSGIENLTSLTYLDLTDNALEGEILPSLASLCNFQFLNKSNNKRGRSLEYLGLGWNKFSGLFLDQLSQCKRLFRLSIVGNSFHGPLPMSMGGLSSLSYLDISENSLEGVVTEENFANLTKLEDLWASSNNFTLQVSSDWIPPFQLTALALGSWHLGPQFPPWLQTLKNLEYLEIPNTGISDSIPNWFWRICAAVHPSMCDIDLSQNQLNGSLPNLPSVGYIHLGSNSFTGSLPQLSSSSIQVDLSNNLLNGSISTMLCRRIDGKNSLVKFDLSGNLLSGGLPDCWQNWTGLGVLNLGGNEFTGPLPPSMASLRHLSSLRLYNNYLSGGLSHLVNCTGLMHMDLSENQFSGSVPTWIGNSLSNLLVLALSSNNFSGSIPLQLCHLRSLQILDLRNNGLSGNIPICFDNFSVMIEQPNSTFPFWFRSPSIIEGIFIPTTWLVVKSRRDEYNYTLGLLTGIDLSCNKLSGEIPEELTALHGLIYLNLSENHLEGRIPMAIGSMKALESLDLSMNKLSGVIPQSISSISFLSYLNLSFNNLSGKIPSGTQIQGFSPLSFIGNHDLYGPPLTHTDENGEDGAEGPTQDHTDEEDSGWIDMKWFYVSMSLGFAGGFWAFWGSLVFNKAWRYAYFRFVDDMIIYKFLEWRM